MTVKEQGDSVLIYGVEYFKVSQTFDCGQCFRFELKDERTASGIAFGKEITFHQPTDDTLVITPCSIEEYKSVWEHYLGFDCDYSDVREQLLSARPNDMILRKAMETGSGIRILNQQPWEALCSFIISQNNNIPRIKKIIEALCVKCALDSGSDIKSFPGTAQIISLGVEGLRDLRVGFRAPYIYDAAVKFRSGEVDVDSIKNMPLQDAERELCKIKGVGPKVAACALLFGFEKSEAFPIDVWVKRVMGEYYGDLIAPSDFGKYAGLAQQYLFYHRRYIEK